MNRFLTKKKSKTNLSSPVEETAAPPLPAEPVVSHEEKKRWRKKKPAPEPEPRLDLGAALPSSDNFRTSLIMPNLSARFSMLREQDDPNSLLGKANDDSVLSPRRRSRMGGFSPGLGLDDIDEVSSIAEPIRPPFASSGRQASYSSEPGYATDDDSSQHSGSIMNRARPGEGNVMFGGRQKIYKIPIGDSGAVRAPGSGEARGMRGRALYEDDVSLSSFQKYKEKEKEREREMERHRNFAEGNNVLDFDLNGGDSVRSPSLSLYDEKRETTSSTNSGPYSLMSTSTAPTSIHSHATNPAISPGIPSSTSSPALAPVHLERTRSKRLYEQGLNQHLHDQQSANMDRFTPMKRNPSGNEKSTSPAKTSLKSSTQASLTSHRAASPVPQFNNANSPDTVRERKGSASSKSRTTPPHSRPLSPSGDELGTQTVLTQAMRPTDRGKATAMGQFNRPKAYDDQEWYQRQMSLHKQYKDRNDIESSKPSNSPVKQYRPSPLDINRARAQTNRSDRSWSASSGTQNETSAFSAVSNSSQNDQRIPSPAQGHARKSSEVAGTGTFFSGSGDDNDSDNDGIRQTTLTIASRRNLDDQSPGLESPGISAPMHRVPPPIFHHPAMRASPSLPDIASPSSKLSPREKKDRRNAWNPNDIGPEIPKTPIAEFPKEPAFEPDLPSGHFRREDEAKPNGSTGLSGLVREHLRQPSNQSSIYPNTPTLSTNGDLPGFELRVPSEYSQITNPWDTEDWGQGFDPSSTREIPSTQTQNTSSISTITPNPLFSRASNLEVKEPSIDIDGDPDLRGRHLRGSSSETQHDRVAFSNELAERQRTIQENLRIKNESRSPSPHMNSFNKSPFDTSLKPFGILSKKASADSIGKQEASFKASKSTRTRSPILPGADTGARNGGRKASIRDGSKSPAPVGRTLHSRMPRQSEDELPPSQGKLSVTGSQDSHQSPPESSRTSTSRETATPSEVSSERHLRHPVKHTNDSVADRMGAQSYEQVSLAGSPPPGSLEISRSPPFDTAVPVPGRFRKDSNGSTCTTFPRFPIEPTPGRNFRKDEPATSAPQRPPLPTSNSQPAPLRPVVQKPVSTQSSPLSPSPDTTAPLSHSTPNLLIPTNTSLAQTPLAKQAPQIVKSAEEQYQGTTPPAAFNFPQRTPAQKPQRHRKGTINKSEISDPTLISSTSTTDTVPLPQGASLRNDGAYDSVLGSRYGHESPTSPDSGTTSPPLANKDANRRTFRKAFGSIRDKQGASNARKTGNDSHVNGNTDLNTLASSTALYTHFPAAHSRKPSAPGAPEPRFIRQLDGTADLAGDDIIREETSRSRNGSGGSGSQNPKNTSMDRNEKENNDDFSEISDADDGDDGYKPIGPSAGGRLRIRKLSPDAGLTDEGGAAHTASPRSARSGSGSASGSRTRHREEYAGMF